MSYPPPTGPVPGQLVSMAVPLGQPRLEPGVRQSATPLRQPGNAMTSTPVPVTAARNVAVVSFPMEDIRERTRVKQPELATQVTKRTKQAFHFPPILMWKRCTFRWGFHPILG